MKIRTEEVKMYICRWYGCKHRKFWGIWKTSNRISVFSKIVEYKVNKNQLYFT